MPEIGARGIPVYALESETHYKPKPNRAFAKLFLEFLKIRNFDVFRHVFDQLKMKL